LAVLATRYHTTVAQLQSANHLTDEEPNAGSLLIVPAVAQPIITARATRPAVRSGVRPGARTQTIARTPIRRPAQSAYKAAPKQPARKAAPTVASSAARRKQG
jgi:LysM repeat protein